MDTNETLTFRVIGCAMEVHRTLGPGLLESVYEKALMIELERKGIKAKSQVPVQVRYKDTLLDETLRLDILVEDELVLELKSVEEMKPLYGKQLLTYLKVTNKKLGLLINFNVENLVKGIKRVIN